jgi:predicted metal-dependent enzyme (double-stranded beta helix superfamily)
MTTRSTPAQDEYFLDTPALRGFIADVRRIIAGRAGREGNATPDTLDPSIVDPSATLDALQPRFAALLADPTWLSPDFAAPYEASGMGGGIASWLLFRDAERSLSLISLVVPPGSQTPVHDHLAWGFVGLYRGEQEEIVYARAHIDTPQSHSQGHSHDTGEEHAPLTVAAVNHLKPGDFYKLLPPDGDIHSVKTTSQEPSISIHLLANDIGCVVRHAFNVEQATARAFRSGYSNMPCDAE